MKTSGSQRSCFSCSQESPYLSMSWFFAVWTASRSSAGKRCWQSCAGLDQGVEIRGTEPVLLGSRFRYESISDSSHGQQMLGMPRVILDVAAQPHDEIIDRARVGILVQSPYLLQ